MARCIQSAQEFIIGAFPAMVGALASEDAEAICQKNDLSFVELIRPFCQLNEEVHIHDPVNPNIVISVRNWKMRVIDIQASLPPPVLVNRVLTEVVNKSVHTVDLNSRVSVEKQINASTPWYEAYRDCFFQLIQPMNHEFLRDYLACILVVSTKHPDPMNAFAALSTKQNNIQHRTEKSKGYNWFSVNTFKYYLLLHDISDGEEAKAEAVYQSMKSVYGSHTCFLLQINSRQKTHPHSTEENFSDPWSQHIYPFSDETLDIDEADLETTTKPSGPITNQKDADKKEEAIVNELESIEKQLEENQGSPRSLSFNDPLTSMHYNDTLDDDIEDDAFGPLSAKKNVQNQPTRPRKISERTLKLQEYKRSLGQFSYRMVGGGSPHSRKERGLCMTPIDQNKIKEFIYEFAVRGLLPHIEKLMRSISEQLLARRGIHKSIFNATKKWFGSNKAQNTVGQFSTGSSYNADSTELQYRRIGDLSFLVQHYELAYNSYHSAKREFNNDHAWLYFAGALEMSAISAFMQGTRPYPVHYFEACVSTYLNTCRLPHLATRACLMSTEALKATEKYPEAAVEYIKLTNEDSDLRSALLLEQAAHCYLHNNQPLIRKYAFHMILAGHRYSKSVQRKHTLRCYINALQVYEQKGWHLAEDHVNFIIGRQSFNLGNLNDAQLSLKALLSYESQQPPSQQAAHLREFLAVFKQNLESKKIKNPSSAEKLPMLQLPVIDCQATRCLLYMQDQVIPVTPSTASTPTSRRSRTVYAGSYTFQKNFSTSFIKRWAELEKKVVQFVTGDLPYPFKPYTPCLSVHTDNKSKAFVAVGEQFAYEIQCSNPLKIPLNLLQLSLLWEFQTSSEDSAVITNKESEQPDYIWTEVIENFQIKPGEKKPACLRLISKTAGHVRITGIKYTLSSIGVISSVDEYGKSELSMHQEGILKSVGILGMQSIDVKGPRLNANKQQKSSVVYGVDKRLETCILPVLPLLEVKMNDLPVTLLCGEVQKGYFQFKNVGQVPLKNLHIACSRPQCFSFGNNTSCQTDQKDSSENSGNRKFINSCYKIPQDYLKKDDSVVKIPLENNRLAHGEEITLPVFMYGLDTSGVHEVDFLFYYEPEESITEVPYRFLQQMIRLQTLSTLNLLTASRKTKLLQVSNTDEITVDRKDSESKEQLLVSLTIENRAQGSLNLRCVEFTLKHLQCYSSKWKVESLVNLPIETYRLRPGETCSLHLKAIASSKNNDLEACVSTIPLGVCDQNMDDTPLLDLFLKSPVNAQAVIDSLGLILFWETFYIDEGFTRNVIMGQSHATLTKSKQYLENYTITAHAVATQTLSAKDHVSVSYEYTAIVKHDFAKNSICIVPVTVKCFNMNNEEVEIEIETIDLYDDNSQVPVQASSLIQWVGRREGAFTVSANSDIGIVVNAMLTTVGIYEIQNINVYVRSRNSNGKLQKIALVLPKLHYIIVEDVAVV